MHLSKAIQLGLLPGFGCWWCWVIGWNVTKLNEMGRRQILIGVDWFLPAFRAGGPIRSVANLVDLLMERDWVVWVLTGAYDLGDVEPLDVTTGQWIQR